MTRVYKGKGPKGGAYLACALAKTGGGCEYHAVRYERVEAAFLRDANSVLNQVPAGGDLGIDQAVESMDAALLYLDEQRTTLLEALRQQGPSPVVTARLRDVENQITELREAQNDLLIRQADSTGPAVARKVTDLKVVLRKKPLDRAVANALLRQVFTGIVVDYTGNPRFLLLRWRQGGESIVTYGMEPAK